MKIDSSQKLPGTFMPLAIGLVGLFLGALSLYITLTQPARNQLIHDSSDRLMFIEEQLQVLDGRLDDFEDRSSFIRNELTILKRGSPSSVSLRRNSVLKEEGDVYYHMIELGDTISGLAVKYGVSTKEIQNVNSGLNARGLQLGQQVKIPKSRG